jgi:dUTP pyrophosphatase
MQTYGKWKKSAYGKGIVEALADKTNKEYNIDILTLDPGSHKKVCVRCTRCEETFTREFRMMYQLHSCPTRKMREDGVELKWCNSCTSWLCLNQFTTNVARKDGLASLCQTCTTQRPSTKRHNASKATLKKSDINVWLRHRLNAVKTKSKRGGTACDITVEYLLNQWDVQAGKCFYLKVPLVFGVSSLYGATIERLDSSLGYIKGNVVIASKFANLAKNRHAVDEFKHILSDIVILNSGQDTPRIEFMAVDPDAVMPHRERASDAGYDIHALHDEIIMPGTISNIDTGIIFVAPIGYYMTIEGRSSLYKSGIVPNRGIIDGCFTGTINISLHNVGTKPYHINKKDRVAQIIPHRLISMDIAEVDAISPEYNIRGTAGFGSSGR